MAPKPRAGKKSRGKAAKAKTRRSGKASSKLAKKNSSRLKFILGPVVVVALAVAVWVWLVPSARPPAPVKPAPAIKTKVAVKSPAFEESRPVPALSNRLQDLDEAIFEGLRQAGVDPVRVKIIAANGHEDGATVLLVRLDSGQDIQAVRKSLTKRIAPLRAKIDWRKRGDNWEMLVSLGSGITHRLRIWAPRRRQEAGLEQRTTPLKSPKPSNGKPRAALVIDDLGYQLGSARKLLAMKLDFTFSVLPHGNYSKRIIKEAKAQGLEVMLHLPMEPKSYPATDPGPGALLVDMDAARIKQQTVANLESVPGVAGANNHMGSAFTEKEDLLRPVMLTLKDRGLFFLDSLTSPRSKAREVARETGLVSGQRHLFIDHDYSPQAVRIQMERFLRMAKRKPGLIAIAHPHASTIAVLKEFSERLRRELCLEPVSAILAMDETALASRGKAEAGGKGRARP